MILNNDNRDLFHTSSTYRPSILFESLESLHTLRMYARALSERHRTDSGETDRAFKRVCARDVTNVANLRVDYHQSRTSAQMRREENVRRSPANIEQMAMSMSSHLVG